MKIFISSSWINKHAVVMLTKLLEVQVHTVDSFVQDNRHEVSTKGKNFDPFKQPIDYEKWVESAESVIVFQQDILKIQTTDILIIIEPAGRDAWAHVGLAYGKGKPVLGLNSKGREVGLMRRMAVWFEHIDRLLEYLNQAEEWRKTPKEE